MSFQEVPVAKTESSILAYIMTPYSVTLVLFWANF